MSVGFFIMVVTVTLTSTSLSIIYDRKKITLLAKETTENALGISF